MFYMKNALYAKLIVDIAAGAEDNSIVFANACNRIVVVIIGEPTSFIDSYALIKAINATSSFKNFSIVVNQTENYQQSIELFKRTLSQNNCAEIRAYGTSALKEANNADEVILRIEALDGSKSEKRKLDSITIVPVLQSLYAYELATSFRRERLVHCALIKKHNRGLTGLASSLKDKSLYQRRC